MTQTVVSHVIDPEQLARLIAVLGIEMTIPNSSYFRFIVYRKTEETRRVSKGTIVFGSFTLEEILEKRDAPTVWMFEHHGVKSKINLRGYRLNTLLTSQKCVKCGRTGVEWKVERNQAEDCFTIHLNLYTTDGVMMTVDHIIPKSRGGKDSPQNLQTMCAPCNQKKGNLLETEIELAK